MAAFDRRGRNVRPGVASASSVGGGGGSAGGGGGNGIDLSGFARQELSARNEFAAKSAANTFSKTLGQQRGSRTLNDFQQGFRRQLPSFTAGFAQRGMSGPGVGSGVFQRAMQNHVGDYTRDLGRITEDNFNRDQEFDFSGARFAAERDSALANIEAQKAQTIASTAQQIAALRPYMGGS